MSESLAEILDQLAGSSTAALKDATVRAHEARDALKEVKPLVSPEDLYNRLLLCRHVTDLLETQMVELILFKAKVDQAVADRRGEVEDAEIAARPYYDDFTSAREKGVQLNAATISSRIKVRKAERLQREMNATLEYVRVLHRGADGTRRDVEVRLRAVSLIAGLEKGGN